MAQRTKPQSSPGHFQTSEWEKTDWVFNTPYSRTLFQNLIWLHISQSPVSPLLPPLPTPGPETKQNKKPYLFPTFQCKHWASSRADLAKIEDWGRKYAYKEKSWARVTPSKTKLHLFTLKPGLSTYCVLLHHSRHWKCNNKQMRSGLHGDGIPVGEDLPVEMVLSKEGHMFF